MLANLNQYTPCCTWSTLKTDNLTTPQASCRRSTSTLCSSFLARSHLSILFFFLRLVIAVAITFNILSICYKFPPRWIYEASSILNLKPSLVAGILSRWIPSNQSSIQLSQPSKESTPLKEALSFLSASSNRKFSSLLSRVFTRIYYS